MITFPNFPRLPRGAIVGLDPLNPLASLIVLQYNPETLPRTLTPQVAGGEGTPSAPGQAMRLARLPREEIGLDVVIDTIAQLERAQQTTAAMGIQPQLSALETLLYPKSALAIANEVLPPP